MTGLVAVFDPRGGYPSVAELIPRLPTHASRSEQWHDQFCTMARLHHGVLETTPQPAFNDAQSLCLFIDGEIYATRTDQDDVGMSAAARFLKIYEGAADSLASINGSFAAIIYDRARPRVILISDRLGTRPLYYFRDGGRLVVASHVAALTAHPRCPKRIDRSTVHQVLAYQQVIGHGTIYSGVHRLESGAVFSFDGEMQNVRRYWIMRWQEPFSSKNEAAEALGEELRRAVARRVNGRARAGLLLSGGFDSRLILAAERPILCITRAASRNREVEVAERVARLMKAEFRFIQIDPIRYEGVFDEAVRLTGGIQKAQSCHFLSEMEGIKTWCDVLLSGWGFNSIYRGLLLPARSIRIGGLRTRMPKLIDIRTDDLVGLIVRTQNSMPRWSALAQILDDKTRTEHNAILEDAVREGLSGFDGSSPSSLYNAWDYLGIHAIARNLQYGNVLSIRTWMDDRVVALDSHAVDTVLRLRPEWRVPQIAYRLALQRILPSALADVPHAGTGLPLWWIGRQLTVPILRAKRALEKARLWPGVTTLHPLGTSGSWPNFEILLRRSSAMHDRLRTLSDSETLATCKMFDRGGLRRVIGAHINGEQKNTELMLTLLSLESWIRQFGAAGTN